MNKHLSQRILSLLLVFALVLGFGVPVQATEDPDTTNKDLRFTQVDGVEAISDDVLKAEAKDQEETQIDPEEMVRASIVLETPSTLDAGFSTQGIATNRDALNHRAALRQEQAQLTARIERELGETLDVQWNLTLAANMISVNVAYGKLETISAVPGVQTVILENRYDPATTQEGTASPNMITSPGMIGSFDAYSGGYTGAGRRVAVVDTGIDVDHQSVSAEALMYALSRQAELKGTDEDTYVESLNLLDAEEINGLLDQLNVSGIISTVTAEELYKNAKIPFGFNYIDKDAAYIDHNKDNQGGHGSHVAGIATANGYIPQEDGSFRACLEEGLVQGVAPDAQLIVLKVFGRNGGAYDSDYMAAIEDAIVLGCDAVNLSLGMANPGFTRNSTYPEILDNLSKSDTVVVMSGSNSGHWADYALHQQPGYLYADDVSMFTAGEPGTYPQVLSVASVDNDGGTGYYITAHGTMMFFTEGANSDANPLPSIAGEHEYIFLDGVGTEEEFAAIGADVLTGKIAICSRGETSFFEKAEAAVRNGAIATIIYNNQSAPINMDLWDYTQKAPCVCISQADGAAIRAGSVPVTGENGEVRYLTGKLTVSGEHGSMVFGEEYYTMSSFSSYGVPGTLELKPEITAPGGNIYSINGTSGGGKTYTNMSGTSMAAPQVTGMAALVGQYIDENLLLEKTNLTRRALIQSLMMSTAVPMEESAGAYFPVFRQGAGLADVGAATSAQSYILMEEDATEFWADGKVKAELGHDPQREGVYTFGFTVNALNDETQRFMLSAELFTQGLFEADGLRYLDNATTALQAAVEWTVDGQVIEPAGDVSQYDFDGNGVVNHDDAQAIVDYMAGNREELSHAELADLDGDGAISTHDAHVLLNMLNCGMLVLHGDSAQVQVTITLTDAQKDALDENYVNGAYVEGYIFVRQLANEEGVAGTVHTVPMLAFYGNWSDASMFDHGSYTSALYGDKGLPYAGIEDRNTMLLQYYGSSDLYYSVGNPYLAEDSYPAGREAISMRTVLSHFLITPIRNMAAMNLFITNQDGEYLFIGEPSAQVVGAFFNLSTGNWQAHDGYYGFFRKVSSLGVEEGDRITISVLAIPEYYEEDGTMTRERIMELFEGDELGKGTVLSRSYTIDSVAPEMVSVQKDLQTGNLIVEAKDDRYLAAIEVRSKGDVVFATVCPEQTGPGETCRAVIDLSHVQGEIGPECLVVVGDYAKNETAYVVSYGEERQDDSGKFFYYSNSCYRTIEKGWFNMEPDKVWYWDGLNHGGTTFVSGSTVTPLAGDYVGGYVFVAGNDGYYYTSRHGEWGGWEKVGYWKDAVVSVRAMSFSYADNTMYMMGVTDARGRAHALFSVDLITGETTMLSTITFQGSSYPVHMMCCDDVGNFYAVSFDNKYYRFRLDDIVDGKLTVARYSNTPVAKNFAHYGSLAWDHDKDELYMACCMSLFGAVSGPGVYKIDTETGKGTITCDYDGGFSENCPSRLADYPVAMYIVPSSTVRLKTDVGATSLSLDRSEVSALVNTSFRLNPTVYPWCLKDKSINWTSSDTDVAVVNDGTVTLVGVGTATITATTNASPNLTATCTVTATELDNIRFSAQITGADGRTYWSDTQTDNLSGWAPIYSHMESSPYRAGALVEDMLYVHDNRKLYRVDADTFVVTDLGEIATDWQFTDAAVLPATGELEGGLLAIGNNRIVIMNPEEGTARFFNAPTGSTDPVVALAYAGPCTYDYGSTKNLPAQRYYMLTEDGALYEGKVFASGDLYNFASARQGKADLILDGVANQFVDRYASMIYDEATGYLLLSAHTKGSGNQLYAIDPATQLATLLGDFGEGVQPVVSLYQYDRYTELGIKMKTTEAKLFAEETLRLNAQVLPITYRNEMTWVSSDPRVATVDENGLVTAIQAGTAVITATSVDKDEEGKPATASCTVTVRDLTQVSATVHAQVVTEEGAGWVSIDTSTKALTHEADASVVLNGGGVHAGKIYGSVGTEGEIGNMYIIDPANGFTETKGAMSDYSYFFRDGTTLPAQTITVSDWTGERELNAYGFPLYITEAGTLTMLLDAIEGTVSNWSTMRWPNNTEKAAALAYAGDSVFENAFGNTFDSKVCYVVTDTGMLYLFHILPSYYTYGPNKVSYSGAAVALGDLGVTFKHYSNVSMTLVEDETNKGLVLSYYDESGAELYYIDLKGETPTCGKICSLPGVESITSLYTASELTGEGTNSVPGYVAGTAETPSSTVSFARSLPTVVKAEEVRTQTGGNGNNIRTNGMDFASDCQDGIFTLTLRLDEETTNSLLAVDYDTGMLTLMDSSSALSCRSIREDEGSVTLAFADSTAISSGTATLTLRFKVEQEGETSFIVRTMEKNDDLRGNQEIFFATVPEHEYEAVVTPATCTEGGYTTFTCKLCGKSYVDEYTEPTGHRFGDWFVTVPATCTEDGEEMRQCVNCDHAESRVIPAFCPSGVYSDVPMNIWYHEAVDFVTKCGIMEGMGDGKFWPDGVTTRGQLVTVLYRMAGMPAVEDECGFTDVPADSWYHDAVVWAYVSGITTGMTDTLFAPSSHVTREQVVTFLCRYAGFTGMDTTATGDLSAYADADLVSGYALPAMTWAVEQGIITGMGEDILSPGASSARAQIATMLMRFLTLGE